MGSTAKFNMIYLNYYSLELLEAHPLRTSGKCTYDSWPYSLVPVLNQSSRKRKHSNYRKT